MSENYWSRRSAVAERETSGAVVTVPDYPEWKFTIGRKCAWNSAYHRAVARVAAQPEYADYLARASADDYKPTDADAALDRRMLHLGFAEGLLLYWSGVTAADGGPLAHSVANAATLFAAFPDIFAYLNRASESAATFAALPTETPRRKAKTAAGN